MKKIKRKFQVHPRQLGLFDILDGNKDYPVLEDSNTVFSQGVTQTINFLENDTDNRQQRQQSNVGQQSGSIGNSRTGELQSFPIILPAERSAAREIQRDEIIGDINSIPERNSPTLLRTGEGISPSGDAGISGGGNSMDKPGGTGGVVNYSNDAAFYDFVSFGKQRHYQDNISALVLLYLLDTSKRLATPEEQSVLAKYAGWGGLKEVILDPKNDNEWKTQSDISVRPFVQQVHDAIGQLDPDGSQGLLKAAQRSILSAYYTSYPIINSIYQGLEKAGFTGGKILDPSAGIGNFLAAMPEEIANRSEVTAIEMDFLTGSILRHLFPTAETKIAPFEKTKLPEASFDLILSNVPFADVAIYDPQLEKHPDKAYARAANNLNNYFFAKSILLAKPGGVVAFITSRYTLDNKQSPEVRELMKQNCEFLGAVRMPDNAFKANAGTEVVADIIFLRKFETGEVNKQKHSFQDILSIPLTDVNKISGLISYNEYFHKNPSHMLGNVEFGGLYNKEGFNLKAIKDAEIGEAITKVLNEIFVVPIFKENINKADDNSLSIKQASNKYIALGLYDTIGNFVTLSDGSFGRISGENYTDPILIDKAKWDGININDLRVGKNSSVADEWLERNNFSLSDFQLMVVTPLKLSKADTLKIPLISTIRQLTKEVIYKEADGWTGAGLENRRAILKDTYFKFTAKFGYLTSKDNDKVMSLDIDGILMQSLERKDQATNKVIPSDILYKQTINPPKDIQHTENVSDAIMLSIQKKGLVDMNFICELMDKPYAEIMSAQVGDKTDIFINGEGRHISRGDFLSGNILQKINEEEGRHKELYDTGGSGAEISKVENNISQLTKVLPAPIVATDIFAPLHARWLPVEEIKAFIKETIHSDKFDLGFSDGLDEFKLKLTDPNAFSDLYKTQRRPASWVITHALNGVEPIVTFTDLDGKQVFDGQDTHKAKEAYKKIKQSWDEWKYNAPERREKLARIYNEKFNHTVLRKFDFVNFNFPGLLGFVPLKHQTETVFRNVQTLGGINDHMVGAGKTLIQVMTAMELKRLGIANKPLIIGLKSQVPQLYEQFKKAYPLSKVLFPTEKDFSKDNRQRLLNNIATNNWDCIILSHDQFNAIPQPVKIQAGLMDELADGLRKEIREMEGSDKQMKKALEGRLYNYEQKLDKLNDSKKDINVLDFSKLGIDFLMVDESQEYKNLEFTTRKRNIRGLGNPMGSKKAFNLLVACRHLQGVHKGDKGILFCSGTPISNSMAELFLLFKYLRPAKLKMDKLETFDRWAANYANDYADLEYYMGKFKEVHRFRDFENLPELMIMYREIADVRNDSNLTLDKPKAIHNLVKILPSENQLNYIQMLQSFIETKGKENADRLGLTAGYDEAKGVNPSFGLLAINFAKKLSLDPRMIDPSEEPGTKINQAADNIVKIFADTSIFKGTQLMFCDIGTPKGTNVLDNFHAYLEGEISQSDLHQIFNGDYHEMKNKPTLEEVQDKAAEVLKITPLEVNDLMAEANYRDRFSVYDELKKVLVQKNIPSDQIAFIHDYKTRKQKDSLYAAVNNGDIRIVFGSTKKLGTGVNVQQRLAALHHLDISWRPSDMEQRNGRGERQGNWAAKTHLNNKIACFYYATERTLDASMYNTVSLKARFIAQIKTTVDVSIRTIKDLEEDVDMGGMAAELSGDPIFKEKATLQKKITELEQSNRGYLLNLYNLQDKIRQSGILLSHYAEKIVTLEKAIPVLKYIPIDSFGEHIFVGISQGHKYDKLGEFGRAMIEQAEYSKKISMVSKPFELGSIWDFKILGEMNNSFGGKDVSWHLISPYGDKLGSSRDLPGGEMAAAMQARDTILKMPQELDRIKKAILTANENLTEYQKQASSENPFTKDLNEKKERSIVVNEIIKARAVEVAIVKDDINIKR